MADIANPSPTLLGELAASTKPSKAKSVKAPPMPKAVAERLKALDVAPTLAQDDKVIVGEAKSASEAKPVEQFPDIPVEDRTAFLAHLLGAPFFKKSYELFGGAVIVTFRTRSGVEDEACARTAQKEVPEPAIPDVITPEIRLAAAQAGAERLRLYRELAMIVSLCDIRWDGRPPLLSLVEGPIEKANLVDIRNQFIATTPGTLLGTLRVYHDRFELLTNTMISLADRPGFWKAVSAS